MILLKWFGSFVGCIFFNRVHALLFCLFFAILFYFAELRFCIDGLFSSSGAIFTLAGIFLNIKLTAHFHLKTSDGKPLGTESKYAMLTGAGVFGGSESLNEKERFVKNVERDELWGAAIMVLGTLIWGFGSFLF
ncbi:hypothetical protein ACI77F_10070 [Pseudomonas tritici]|uniref:hypothetical protein n=1 Tax=Pseudomonas tritici TaxID=2745518 RepID=UPI00387B7D07